jgi:hypothetical protein
MHRDPATVSDLYLMKFTPHYFSVVQVPLIDILYYSMGIHDAICKYFESLRTPQDRFLMGKQLWLKLDAYFMDVAREAFEGAPQHDNQALVLYTISTFHRYSAQVQCIEKLLHQYNEIFVNTAKLGEGWLSSIEQQYVFMEDDYLRGAENIRSRVLAQWGGIGQGSLIEKEAEACVEAASPSHCVVSISSLAYRRFRMQFFRPLLAVPDGIRIVERWGDILCPGGDLVVAYREVRDDGGLGVEERKKVTEELATALRICGVRVPRLLGNTLKDFMALLYIY